MLLTWLLLMAAAKLAAPGRDPPPSRTCHQLAVMQPPEAEWLSKTSTPRSRPLPDIHDRLLGFGNWPEDDHGAPSPATYEAWSIKTSMCQNTTVARFKLYNGVLYSDASSSAFSNRLMHVFVEQLFVAKFLYKGIPDKLDIAIVGSDGPAACDMELPMMQFTILHPYSLVTGEPLSGDLGRLVVQSWGTSSPGKARAYTRGYSMPYLDAWNHTGLSPGQMAAYMDCVQQRYGGGVPAACRDHGDAQGRWAAVRKPKLVWRGSTTGRYRGWADGVVPSSLSKNSSRLVSQGLWNKRFYLAVMARPYPHLDIGLSSLMRWHFHPGHVSPREEDMLLAAVHKPHLSLEEQSGYQLALSIDGNAGPWRYGMQMLGLTPIVRVDTPYREFFHHWLVPGVHYEPAKADLSDFVTRTRQLLDEAARDSTRLQCMAVHASQVAVERMNSLAQLDSFVWSLLKVQAAYDWDVLPPAREAKYINWQPWSQGSLWYSPGLAHIKKAVMKAFPRNYDA